MFKAAPRTPQAGPSSGGQVKLNRRLSNSGPSDRYPFRLNFYQRAPTMDITLEEFEIYAIARLKVLTQLQTLSERSLPPSQYRDLVQQALKRDLNLSSNTARNIRLDDERRKDEIGHWVLRLAFCRSPDLREKFIRTESELFRQRYETDDQNERREFLESLQFDWQIVTDAEKSQLRKELFSCVNTKNATEASVMADQYVKVPWYTVPDLVSTRRVFIKGGNAYVPPTYQISLVLQAFKERLGKALEMTARSLPRMDEDDRLLPILSRLSLSFLTNITATDNSFFGTPGEENQVTADMVDSLAKRHFPACQYNLWKRLKMDRHLKHHARLQFGLFLKCLGLPLDESLIYWRRAFGPTMSDDKFSKEYKYNIRHSYGQEGKRQNYQAKSCQQILTGPQPGAQESHGCPYRHFSPEHLQTFLIEAYPGSLHPGSMEMREVMDSVKKTHYHVACTRVFELTHQANVKKGEGLGGGAAVTHPNEYFSKSLEYEKENAGAAKPEGEAMQVDG